MSYMLKSRKDDRSLNISFDEAMVIHSHPHRSLVPTIFGSGQGESRKSKLSSLSTFKSWRCHSDASGLADVIDKDLRNVEREASDIIRMQYGEQECIEIREVVVAMLRRCKVYHLVPNPNHQLFVHQ